MGGTLGKNSPPRLMLPAKITSSTNTYTLYALVDSGAEQSFMDSNLATQLDIATEALPHALHVSALSSQRLPDIRQITEPVTLTLSGEHLESISVFVFNAPQTPLVLGHSWLIQHNPLINWKRGGVSEWGGGVSHVLSKIRHTTQIRSLSVPLF